MTPRASLLFVLAAVSVGVFAAQKVSIADLNKDPKKYHDQPVKVIGKVEEFRQRTSRAGNAYFTGVIAMDGKKVNLYGRGTQTPAPKKGDSVEVTGVYRQEKKVGTMTFKNEIDVTKDRENPEKTKEFGIKIRS